MTDDDFGPTPPQPLASPRPGTLEFWMEAYLQGDERAFERIYAKTGPKILAWLKRKIVSTAKAEEALQQVFLKFHQSRHQYRSGEVVEAWLFSIVRSTCFDFLRSELRRPDSGRPVPLDEAPASALLAPIGNAEDLLSAGGAEGLGGMETLAALPSGHREAIELRYASGESFESLAKKWKVSEASARQRVSRAVRALRELATGSETEDSVKKPSGGSV